MPNADIYRTRFFEDAGKTFLARILGPTGVYLTQAATSAIAYKVYDQTGALTASGSLTVSSVVFDSLQGANYTDNRWTVDATGFNFLCDVPASAFPAPGTYRVEITFTPVSGSAWPLVYEGPCLGLLGS